MNKIRLKSIYTLLILVMGLFFSSQVFGYEREIKDLSEKIAVKIDESGKKSVAIVDFTDLQGSVTELGRFIAEELSVELMNNVKKIEIIDRNHLKSILKEHKFSMSGLVDPTTIKKVGKIVGVDAIITGSVTPFGDNIRVTCKVISTDTARVISAGKIEIAKTKAIDELLAKGIDDGGISKSESNVQKKPEDSKKMQSKDSKNVMTFPDVTISFLGCELDYSTATRITEIHCKIKITNNGKNREFRKSGNILAFDNFGNKLSGGSLWFKKGGQNATLESGMSAEGRYDFYGKTPNTTMLKLLRFTIQTDAKDSYELEFKDISVKKSDE